MNRVYDIIKNLRTEKGLSQGFMAEKIGISQNSYGRTERGETELTVERLEQIATILCTTPLGLMSMADGNEPPKQGIAEQHENDRLRERIEELEKEVADLEGEYEDQTEDDKKAEQVRNILKVIILPALLTTFKEADTELLKHDFNIRQRFADRMKDVGKFMSPNDEAAKILNSEKGLKIFMLSLVGLDASQFDGV